MENSNYLGRCAECEIWFASIVFEDRLTPEDIEKLKEKWLKDPNIGDLGSLPST